MKAFNDTNVSIAYVFLCEPHSKIAEHIICQEYDDVYWSCNVVEEFQDRVGDKQDYLLGFYEKLEIELYGYRKLYYSFTQLENFANNFSYVDDKQRKDVLSSLEPFWRYYCQYSDKCVIDSMIESVRDFNTFLQTIIFERMDFCEDSYILTDDLHKRTEEYLDLRDVLEGNDVHDEDIEIALDAHHFSKKLDSPLDFITFDRRCCKGVFKSNLYFNKVKGLIDYDFLT